MKKCPWCEKEFNPSRPNQKYCKKSCGTRASAERTGRLWRRYGILISREDYAKRIDLQDGKCLICDKPQLEKALAVDHNHSTGKIRGLLCSNCNSGLGLFLNNPSLLRKAADYLELHDGVINENKNVEKCFA